MSPLCVTHFGMVPNSMFPFSFALPCCLSLPSLSRCFNPDLSITVRSAYGAEEGDSVSICYTDSLWTTAARRENLVYSKVRDLGWTDSLILTDTAGLPL